MLRFTTILTSTAVLVFSFASLSGVQAQDSSNADEIFLPENAILDTSILFAIGAREAQQELRGSYGWDSFQEGLVDGVYFRFDPDGYARFSPNARLDTDLFEVICRPRTRNCMARKGPLTVALNGSGMLQLSIEGVAAGDQFFISDTIDEIELPERILGPLDERFESVLAVGGEMIIRRGPTEMARVSLMGFSAVTAYLRWILAEQDYLVLPRSWPVPNGTSVTASATLTAPPAWRNAVTGASNSRIQDAGTLTSEGGTGTQLASLRALIEEMVNERENPPSVTTLIAQPDTSAIMETEPMVAHDPNVQTMMTHIAELQSRLNTLEFSLKEMEFKMLAPPMMREVTYSPEKDVEMTRTEMANVDMGHNNAASREHAHSDTQTDHQVSTTSDLVALAERIEALSKEFGIEPNVAALLIRANAAQEKDAPSWSVEQMQMLLELSGPENSDLALLDATTDTVEESLIEETQNEAQSSQSDYMLLADYFAVKSN